jgi:hypothetical protein
MPGGKAKESPELPDSLASSRAATGIPAPTIDVGNSASQQASAASGARQRRQARHGGDIVVRETVDR